MEYETEMARVDSLHPWPGNPNQGDVGAIARSIERNGWYGVVIVQKATRRILAGHHRVQAARQLGYHAVPVQLVDVDDSTAQRIVLADNRTTRLGMDDGSALLELLQQVAQEPLTGLDGTGWDGDDLDELLARLNGPLNTAAVWKASGQPDYEQGDKESAYRTTVHFRTDADADAFFEMLGKPKNRYLWWPDGDGHRGSDATEQWTVQE